MPGPSGIKLDDGFSTTMSFALDSTLGVWEVELNLPGFDGGALVPTSTMRNVVYNTFAPRKLQTLTGINFTCQYDTGHYLRYKAMVNKNQQVTVTLPDGRPVTFWGVMNNFSFQRLVEGQVALATGTVTPTNQDASGNEAGPTVGTTTSSTTTTTTTP